MRHVDMLVLFKGEGLLKRLYRAAVLVVCGTVKVGFDLDECDIAWSADQARKAAMAGKDVNNG